MAEEFISEPIKPVRAAFDTARMATGEPGVPVEFTWRGEKFKVRLVIGSWRKTGSCTHGSGEQYVRRHIYEIVTDKNEKMKIYFDRRPQKGRPQVARWWLFSREKNEKGQDF